MVIAKDGRIGNCRLSHSNGNWLFVGRRVSRGIRTRRPAALPSAMVASIRRGLRSRFITSRVPLHKPSVGLMFRSSITGMPGFRSKRCGGQPGAHREFRYSTGMLSACAPSTVLSALRQVIASPGNRPVAYSLMWSMDLLVGASTALEDMYAPS